MGSARVIPASCPPKRRSLLQEDMSEEVVIEDIKKGLMKEKLVVPEFEGRDNSERNENIEQRLRKQSQNKVDGFQKETEKKTERKGVKAATREAIGDSYEKAREQQKAKKEEEQKERKREEERIVMKRREEKRDNDVRKEKGGGKRKGS